MPHHPKAREIEEEQSSVAKTTPAGLSTALPQGQWANNAWGNPRPADIRARDFMVKRLVTLRPEQDVFECIEHLLQHRISGAPVTTGDDRYAGVFSEKSSFGILTVSARRHRERGGALPLARDFMADALVTLDPAMDVFEAIGYLLKHRISGAPVIDAAHRFLGSFSEKTSMKVLIDAAYEQVPTTTVQAFMNPDPKRLIDEDMDLLQAIDVFATTHYRRLPVVRRSGSDEPRLIGQVSRRDVLRAAHELVGSAAERSATVQAWLDGGQKTVPEGVDPNSARAFMDTSARTIAEDYDILRIAQLFLSTPYRRVPVVDGSTLVGQLSRRDVLEAANTLLPATTPRQERTLLYLSSLREMNEAPIE